ncbi:hypothetical protein MHZ92_12375 [Sporosarcina sp. ACRSL]|uniref:hypothetical protein n=1 Tax=Sporosarcina sp. ACRSL TaxID=2918215 RepID=UPI001EF5C478|nr:hypothetical protein [Sporosarcina sp. ACRSL]MCG7344935.1 hypothetical protein [Sporosarcina sp. ACRSL]
MDKRIQAIADRARIEFGLENYRLERRAIFRRGNDYELNMEWFPNEYDGPVEEDMNPDGTASIDYNIQQDRFQNVIFTMGKSYSTAHPFQEKTIEEAAAWLEKQTGLTYEQDFFPQQASENGFQFVSRVDGIRISPNFQLNVEFDDEGKLLSFSTYGEAPNLTLVEKQDFNLTLEEIEPTVKAHLTLVNIPSEEKKTFMPVYAIDEVYVTADGKRCIPFLSDEWTVEVDHLMEWTEPLHGRIERQYINMTQEVSADEAFNAGIEDNVTLTDEQVQACISLVRNALRIEYPDDSGKWILKELRPAHSHIEAFCYASNTDNSLFKRKMALLIDRASMTVINLIDNEAMFEVFDSFAPAPTPNVDHESAFDKMVPYITLDPVYVYDKEMKKYILCGLLDSEQAVDAVTGEIVELRDL